jgi:hypothetical protein
MPTAQAIGTVMVIDDATGTIMPVYVYVLL